MTGKNQKKPTTAKKRPTYSTELIVEAINKSGGRVYEAAERIGCKAAAIYRRAKVCQPIRQAITECRGRLLDVAEDSLQRAVIQGEAWAVCFLLKTKGKARGYIERTEQHQTGKHDHTFRVVQRDDFYGNQAHIEDQSAHARGASAIAASDPGAGVPGPVQIGGLRAPVGQNGNGSHGGHNGARPNPR